jgi:hypothetical protein
MVLELYYEFQTRLGSTSHLDTGGEVKEGLDLIH